MAFDFKKEYKEFYLPKNKPQIVTVPPANYIDVRGRGDPNEGGGAYKAAVGVLYAVAYTIKMSKMGDRRIDGYYDFVVPPLEGFWWQEGVEGFDYKDKSTFHWISVIRVPDFVTKADFDWAVAEATRKKKLDCSAAEYLTIDEGECVQIMHTGAFDDEPATVALMDEYIAANGYENDFSDTRLLHEIYLSDARKVAPEKWKTVIRHPVKKRKEEHILVQEIPAVLYGDSNEKLFLYIHGKMGCKEEAARFAEIVCPKGYQVLSIDLPGHGERADEMERFVPWKVVPELQAVYGFARQRWEKISLYANSIGAYFSLLAFREAKLEKSLFVSPILDMEKLIRDMMGWAGVTQEQLKEVGEIPTAFGETLSWKYLTYATENRITKWDSPTAILYAGQDHLTARKTVDNFARLFGCTVTVMENGEHWFHTEEQLAVLDEWLQNET